MQIPCPRVPPVRRSLFTQLSLDFTASLKLTINAPINIRSILLLYKLLATLHAARTSRFPFTYCNGNVSGFSRDNVTR